jgi:hypothetical protein
MSAPNDITISGCSTEKPAGYSTCYFNTACGRWNHDNQLHTIEFVTSKTNRDKLWNNIVPGKVTDWEITLGKLYWRDTTYYSGNTIVITPIAGTNIADLRDETKIVVKEYREEPWGKPATEYFITLAGYEYIPL